MTTLARDLSSEILLDVVKPRSSPFRRMASRARPARTPTERPSDAVLSLAARAGGLGLCFLDGVRLPDPAGVLQGSGNKTRFLRLESAADLKASVVEALIKAALAQAKPLTTGRKSLIIRSVSARQRPRRKSAPSSP